MISVQIVDDQYLFLESLELFLRRDNSITVSGISSSGKEALEMIRKEPPDILLLDIKLPDISGLHVAHRVKEEFPSVKIIILTTFEEENDILDAFKTGCEGYVVKDIKPAELIMMIKSVYNGLIVLHPAAHAVIRKYINDNMDHFLAISERCSFDNLTMMEFSIVKLLTEGKSNKEIADALHYTEGTIKNYISRIMQKTGCKDRTHIAVQSLKQDIQ